MQEACSRGVGVETMAEEKAKKHRKHMKIVGKETYTHTYIYTYIIMYMYKDMLYFVWGGGYMWLL